MTCAGVYSYFTREVKTMKLATIREFRSSLAGFSKKGEMILVTNHGKMVGCFLPLAKVKEIPIELKKEFVTYVGGMIARSLRLNKVSENQILDDFKSFKKNRR